MWIISILLCVGLFIKLNNLSDEVRALKKQLGVTQVPQQQPAKMYNSVPGAASGTFTPNAVAAQQQSAIPLAPIPQNVPQPIVHTSNEFVDWMKEDILLKIGALFLLMGFGWFVSYAFINNWIGPVGRISLGLFAGLLVTGIGTWRITNYRHQGSVFLVLGSGIVLLTLFAARELYEFLTPSIALVIMFLSVAYVALMSVVYKSDKLALAGLIMAAVAPLLTNTPDPNTLGIMSYLLVVVLGTVWVVRMTGSHALTFAAVIMMILYSLPFMDGGVSDVESRVALFFSFIFAAIFFVTNTISIIMVQTSDARKAQILTAVGTGLYLMMWIGLVISDSMQSLAYVFWMLVFSVGTFFVFTQTQNRIPFYVYGAVTLGFLFAATAAELSGPVLTLAYTAQVAGLVILARFILPNKVSDSLVWLFLLPTTLSLGSFISNSWNTGIMHADFAILFFLMIALAIVGLVCIETREGTESENMIAEFLLGTSLLYFLSLIWLVLHASIAGDSATTVALIIYTILGIGFWFIGQVQKNEFIGAAGTVLLVCVVARLLLIDVWLMDLVGRIVTFLAIGVLLISTAFMRKGKQVAATNEQSYE